MEKDTKQSEIRVSVILPTYRRNEQLKKALHSLANQTFRFFEIVLIDDNDEESWNRSVELIVEQFQTKKKDISLKYIQNHPNLGSAKSRNRGIEEASGEYITFLDDDDVYLPLKVEKQYEFMVDTGSDFSITNLVLYGDNGRVSQVRRHNYIKKTDKETLLQYHYMYHLTGTDTMMFKKAYLEESGGFGPIDMGDEFYLMERAIEGGGVFCYLDRCDVKAFVHNDGRISSGKTKIDGENRLYEHKKSKFDQLSKHSVRYIKMRHHAVLAFAYLHMKEYGHFLIEGMKGFIIDPILSVQLLWNIRVKR